MHYKKDSGFTIIELLIAIVMIGALAALTVSIINPSRLKKTATDATVKALLNKTILSTEGYINSYGKAPNALEFIKSLSEDNVVPKDSNSCNAVPPNEDECIFKFKGIEQIDECSPEGWQGSDSDNNLCFFRYKNNLGGDPRHFRLYIKAHGIKGKMYIYDNKAGLTFLCDDEFDDSSDLVSCSESSEETESEEGGTGSEEEATPPEEPELEAGKYRIKGQVVNRLTKEPIPNTRFWWLAPEDATEYEFTSWDGKLKYQTAYSDENGYFAVDFNYPRATMIGIQSFDCSVNFNRIRLKDSTVGNLYQLKLDILDEKVYTSIPFEEVNADIYDIGQIELWPHTNAYFKSDVPITVDYRYTLDSAYTNETTTIISNAENFVKSHWPAITKNYDMVVTFKNASNVHNELIRFDDGNQSCGGSGIRFEYKDSAVTVTYGNP